MSRLLNDEMDFWSTLKNQSSRCASEISAGRMAIYSSQVLDLHTMIKQSFEFLNLGFETPSMFDWSEFMSRFNTMDFNHTNLAGVFTMSDFHNL